MLSPDQAERIVEFVKAEPRAVNDVAQHQGVAWATAEKYIRQVRDNTGAVDLKVFREGTRGALKLAYYVHEEAAMRGDVEERLYEQVRAGRYKEDFDFLEIYQFVPDEHKRSFIEEYTDELESRSQHLFATLREAEQTVLLFSGNLTFLHMTEKGEDVVDVLAELLARGVRIRILSRITLSTLTNISRLDTLLANHPGLLEIRHAYQPLRGFVIDEEFARFKDEEQLSQYKPGELDANTRIFYEVRGDWAKWLARVFWNVYRTSIDHRERRKEVEAVASAH